MKESLEYLSRPTTSMVNTTTYDNNTILTTFNQAMKWPDLWMEPMLKELTIMKEKKVFHTVPWPVGKNMVKSKWVYANKYNNKGHIVARKAQLVAKGFTQILGEDYDETYAFVARLEFVRLVCVITASLGLRLWQVNFVLRNTYSVWQKVMWTTTDLFLSNVLYIWKKYHELYSSGPNILQQSISLFSRYDQVIVI